MKLQLPTDWEKQIFQLLCALRAEGSQKRCFPKAFLTECFLANQLIICLEKYSLRWHYTVMSLNPQMSADSCAVSKSVSKLACSGHTNSQHQCLILAFHHITSRTAASQGQLFVQ